MLRYNYSLSVCVYALCMCVLNISKCVHTVTDILYTYNVMQYTHIHSVKCDNYFISKLNTFKCLIMHNSPNDVLI